MGSLICVNDSPTPVAGDELIYEVVDGQQRLNTLSLLLMALYANLTNKLKDYSFEDDEEEEETDRIQASIKAKMIELKKAPRPGEPGGFSVGKHIYFLRVQPSIQNHNLEDYLYVLTEIGLLNGQPKSRNCSQRRIYRAFAYFLAYTPTEVPALCDMVRKINQLVFVQITVGSQADAFTLFESLNNRGIPLSAIDIIKNKLLAEMERQHHVDIDNSFTRWQEIIGALPDAVEQERFLRHFYNAFKHLPSVQVEKVTRATKSQIIRIYEALIRRKASAIFEELTSKAILYGTLLRPQENFPIPLVRGLNELQRIGAAQPTRFSCFYFRSLKNNCNRKIFARKL